MPNAPASPLSFPVIKPGRTAPIRTHSPATTFGGIDDYEVDPNARLPIFLPDWLGAHLWLCFRDYRLAALSAHAGYAMLEY